MKLNIFKIAIITIAFAASSIAHAQSVSNDTIYVSNTDIYNLDLNQSSISVNVPYPGPKISGLCGIEIRADSYRSDKPIQNLLSAINIKNYDGDKLTGKIINKSTVLLNLPTKSDSYAFIFSIETKDKSSLRQTIKDTLGGSRTVILLGTTCL